MAIACGKWRPSRRDLLTCASAALAARILPASTQAPHASFPTEPRMRLAVTSYPFRTYLASPKNPERNARLPTMDLTAFPAFIAEKFGVFNINPLVNHFASTEPAYLEAFRSALQKARSHIVDLGLPGGYFYDADAAVRESSVTAAKKFVDVAAQVGSPSVRLHVEGSKGVKPDVAVASSSLGEVAGYGDKKNIVINLENDDQVAEDPFFLVAVIEKVKSPYLRALPDFGNDLIDRDDAYNHGAVKAMLGHVYNMCHVKDIVENEKGQAQHVDLGDMFGLARASGYRGYFSMEFETRAGDPITGTKHLVAETLKYLS